MANFSGGQSSVLGVKLLPNFNHASTLDTNVSYFKFLKTDPDSL
jgi:hypothetical protein